MINRTVIEAKLAKLVSLASETSDAQSLAYLHGEEVGIRWVLDLLEIPQPEPRIDGMPLAERLGILRPFPSILGIASR